MPSARRIVLRSALETGCSVWSLRLCFLDFWWRRWLIQELRLTSLPFRVTRTRLAMPFCVLSLGIGRLGLLRCGLTGRRQDHEEVSTLEQRLALDHRERLSVIRDAIEDPPTDILVDHLAAPEHDRHLDLFSCFEELTQTLELGLEIVLGDLRPKLHLLQLGDVLLAALVFLLLDGLELVASVVNQAADGRARLRRHLDEVETLLVCDPERGVQGKHAQLVVLVVDQSHFGAPDLVVDPQLFKRYGSLPRPNSVLLYSSNHIKKTKRTAQRPSVSRQLRPARARRQPFWVEPLG